MWIAHRDEPALVSPACGGRGRPIQTNDRVRTPRRDVEVLLVVLDRGRPRSSNQSSSPAMRNCSGSQFGRLTRSSFSMIAPDDLGAEPVVEPGEVGARVVDVAGRPLGRRAAGGEVAVAERAQRLAQTLLGGFEALVREQSSGVMPCSRSTRLRSSSRKRADLVGVVERVRRCGRACLAPDDDPEPAALERAERVLVGDVVADVDRQHVGPSRPSSASSQFSAVPLSHSMSGRSSKIILPPATRSVGCPGASRVDRVRDGPVVLVRHLAVVHGDREALALDIGAGDLGERLLAARPPPHRARGGRRRTGRGRRLRRRPSASGCRSRGSPRSRGPRTPTLPMTSSASRPLTIATVVVAAQRAPAWSVASSDSTARSGCSTIGVSVPS